MKDPNFDETSLVLARRYLSEIHAKHHYTQCLAALQVLLNETHSEGYEAGYKAAVAMEGSQPEPDARTPTEAAYDFINLMRSVTRDSVVVGPELAENLGNMLRELVDATRVQE